MEKVNYIAVCDSEKCAFIETTRVRHKGGKEYLSPDLQYLGLRVKHVHHDAMDCPDCGSALFWTTEAILLSTGQKIAREDDRQNCT
jgi:hypothetical protein